jgi:hypothetical protein
MKIAPHCDIETGKIYGCKKGSWMWWHEKGHLAFNELPQTSTLKMWQSIIFYFWMISTTLIFLNGYMAWVSIPTLLFYLGVDVYEEVWANKYADRHWNGKVYI